MKKYQRGDIVASLIVYGVIAACVAGLLALAYHAVGNYFRAPVEAKLKESQEQTKAATDANVALQGDLAKLRAAVADQNAALDLLAKQGDQRVAAAQAALAAERARRAKEGPTISKLETVAATKGDANDCSKIDALLTDIANDRLRFNGDASVGGPDDGSAGAGPGALRVH